MSYNGLKNLEGIVDGLSRLQKLKVLNLEGNNIMKSNLKSSDLAKLKNLEILDLSSIALKGSLTMLAGMLALFALIFFFFSILSFPSNLFFFFFFSIYFLLNIYLYI
uniref:Putative LRR receptor-like serine/threonine-protein kinase At4g36180 isoform X1 n=1 Tax=Rhizophora mucronata TaxID=61149 RepID=A0A2P2MW50_RHIMU